jgi:hypothetical protein
MNFQQFLVRQSACQEARTWAANKTFDQVWETCKRGDWLLWLVGRLQADDRPYFAAAAEIAGQVEHLMKHQQSRDAVATAKRYGQGLATWGELCAANEKAADIVHKYITSTEHLNTGKPGRPYSPECYAALAASYCTTDISTFAAAYYGGLCQEPGQAEEDFLAQAANIVRKHVPFDTQRQAFDKFCRENQAD